MRKRSACRSKDAGSIAQQYEDACKAREEEGAIKLLTGGAAAITGILAIVGTGGMATPVVIGVWVTGGSTALYGRVKR